MNERVDVAVIGSGMIGSAAARHLAEAGTAVALVGAAEPDDLSSAPGPFSSHYDEGRVTRISAFSPQWAELAARSIERYGDLATRSGETFHMPAGLAVIAVEAEFAGEVGAELGADVRSMTGDELLARTGIRVPEGGGHRVVYEGPPAGVINPRAMVRAQRRLVERAGGRLIDDVVTGLRPASAGVEIVAASGTVTAGTVVLATGAYGAGLAGVDLEIERRLHTVVRAEVGPGPLPALIHPEAAHPDLESLYWVPPLRYPNGRTLLKIGGVGVPVETASSTSEVDRWFRSGGSAAVADSLRDSIGTLLPGRTMAWSDQQPCVLTYTPTDLPYVGFVDDRVVVALGGCGAAAKSSDEIGRLAAAVASGAAWPNPRLPAGLFTPRVR